MRNFAKKMRNTKNNFGKVYLRWKPKCVGHNSDSLNYLITKKASKQIYQN